MFENVVVLGGLGEMGRLLARSLGESGIPVQRVDRRAAPTGEGDGRYLQDDITHPGAALRRAIGAADCVIVRLPQDVALAALGPTAEATPEGSPRLDAPPATVG